MAKITLDIPDELIDQLSELGQPIADWLPQQLPNLLTQGRQPAILPAHIYRYILDFIASGPTPQQILDFRPTPAMQDRLRSLVDRARSGGAMLISGVWMEKKEGRILLDKAKHQTRNTP